MANHLSSMPPCSDPQWLEHSQAMGSMDKDRVCALLHELVARLALSALVAHGPFAVYVLCCATMYSPDCPSVLVSGCARGMHRFSVGGISGGVAHT